MSGTAAPDIPMSHDLDGSGRLQWGQHQRRQSLVYPWTEVGYD